MSIKNERAYLDSIWDWQPLHPCFQRGIQPTDLDGFVEVGGYFFLLEGKAPGVPVPIGQQRMFDRMLERNKIIPQLFTIAVLWGDAKSSRIDRLQFWPKAPFDADWITLQDYVGRWSCWAEKQSVKPLAPLVVDSLIEIRPSPRPVVKTPELVEEITADMINWGFSK